MDSAPAVQVAAAIDSDIVAQLNSAESNSLLDTIDALRELGVSNFVDLPQIIVVGDQSSGKSSVLEAISRVQFPVDGDICTRFATELILRRAPGSESTSSVSIQFADEGHAARPSFKKNTFDKEKLAELIKEAKEVMGIRNGGAKQFSKDILRIEVTGPDVPSVTLVDLPGIFHSATADQDGKGREIVNQLIDSYMRQSKSIILAVVAADQQLAGQAVLDKAVEYDPKRERTIGVITKPDMAGRQNEKKYLDLAKGRETMHKLALGWYVLRNRSEEERSSEAAERDAAEEAFFRSSGWSSINPANRGVESLRKRLSKVLLEHIRNSLPELIDNIDLNLWDRKRELNRLGKSRSTAEELRSYLVGIADDFQRLANDAIEGRYGDEFFGDLDQEERRLRKLRAVLRNMHWAFEVVMETKGARYEILSSDGEDWKDEEEENDADDNGEGSDSDAKAALPDYLQELVDGYDAEQPEPKSVAKLSTELEAAFNRGKEFPGDVNPELVFLLFKKQATPWKAVSQQHLDHVLGVTKVFVEQLFTHIVGPDDVTLSAILGIHVDRFFNEKKDELETKLKELLRPYVSGYGFPLEREARTRLHKTTFERLGRQLAARLERSHPDLFGESPRGRLTQDQIVCAVCEPESPDRNASGIEKVIDMMTVQYNMSLGTFTENVINLAVESCLVHHIPSILTTRKVDRMTFEELKELASESEDIQTRRADLEAEVKILEEGLRKCQKHKPRALVDLPRGVSPAHRPSSRPPTPSRAASAARLSTPAGDPTPSPARKANPPFQFTPAPVVAAGTASISASTSQAPRSLFSIPGSGPQATSIYNSTAAPAGTSLFAPSAAPAGTSLFAASAAPANTSLFSTAAAQKGTGVFNTTAAPKSTGLFSVSTSSPGTGLFSSHAPPTGTGLFGAPAKTEPKGGKDHGKDFGA